MHEKLKKMKLSTTSLHNVNKVITTLILNGEINCDTNVDELMSICHHYIMLDNIYVTGDNASKIDLG